MLGWVITCHDERAQDMLDTLEAKFARLRNAGWLTTGGAKH